MKCISHDLKEIFFSGVSIRILNLTLKQLRSISKSRNIDGYKSMSKNQLAYQTNRGIYK